MKYEFKNEAYVWLSCQMRAFASLFIAISANTPFDYEWDDGKFHTIITGNNSSRWATSQKSRAPITP